MIKRDISKDIIRAAKQLPIVAVTGPRQSGKTTLVKEIFKNYKYVNFENLDDRYLAKTDPKAFLSSFEGGIILDEVQNIPELFSYIQVISDEINRPGKFILTGSHNFQLMESITQSLAGRVAIFNLLPLSLNEMKNIEKLSKQIVKGFYPRLYNEKIDNSLFYSNYISTYIERDVRQLKNITDLTQFQNFVKLCAYRVGQILNLSSLALDAGISVNTAKSWLSLLKTSFIIFTLEPYYENMGKRIIKSPKLYFLDTGIVSHLIGINETNYEFHSMKGHLFENFIVAELYKEFINKPQSIYFWRDKTGVEIDCIVEYGSNKYAIEIKSGQTINSDYTKNLDIFRERDSSYNSVVIYGGNEERRADKVKYIPWQKLGKFAF